MGPRLDRVSLQALATRRHTLLAGCLLALAVLAVPSPKGMTVVLAAAALVTVAARPLRATLRLARAGGYRALLGAWLAWSLASVSWAPAPGGAALLWLRLALVMAAGHLLVSGVPALAPHELRRLQGGVIWCALVIAALLLFETANGGAITWAVRLGEIPYPAPRPMLGQGGVLLSLVVWPAALLAARRFGSWGALGVLVLAAAALAVSPSMAAQLAFALALLVFVLALRWPRSTALAMAWGLPLGVFAAPFAIHLGELGQAAFDAFAGSSMSITHRGLIWQFVAERVVEKPWLGWGLDASRHMTGTETPYFSQRQGGLLPLHPHNWTLQLWLELGLPGALLGAALLATLAHRIAGWWREPAAVATCLAALTAYFVVANLGYGIWQNWWVASAWLAAFAVALALRGSGLGAVDRPVSSD